MDMANVELVATYSTLAGSACPHSAQEYSSFDFKDRVEAAAKAGFKGFGIKEVDLAHILESRSLKEMKRILDDNGMKHVELEFITDWFMDGEGEFDVKGFIDCMLKAGYQGPWGIEVLSQDIRSLPLDVLATRAFNTTMAQFPGVERR